jgi:hypothetical protein
VFLKALKKQIIALKKKSIEQGDVKRVMALCKGVAEYVLHGILKVSYKKP